MPGDFRIYGHSYQEFLILRNMRPAGPKIGMFGDTPLHEAVEDEWGRIYRYVGICSVVDRKYSDTLSEREFVLPPGIIYRMLEQSKREGLFDGVSSVIKLIGFR
jgi:hypothetical protein